MSSALGEVIRALCTIHEKLQFPPNRVVVHRWLATKRANERDAGDSGGGGAVGGTGSGGGGDDDGSSSGGGMAPALSC